MYGYEFAWQCNEDDEPEIVQEYLKIKLDEKGQKYTQLITSHSPYIISCLKPAWIHVGVNIKPGVAEFFTFKKTGRKRLENDAASFDMGMSDYLFSMLADSESNISDYLECDADE